MKIILNSDILYTGRLVTDNLPKKLQELFCACAERGHDIVIPLTALLEFSRKQSELVESEISRLENAYSQLDKFEIPYTRIEPLQAVKQPDLIGLIEKLGVEVIVEEPTKEDLMEAHRRACLHECPHPPDAGSDEMRDLVIWMVALRLALQDGDALLISRDKVHVHSRGDSEAIPARLVRVSRIEDALDYLDMETPTRRLVERLLAPVWDDLIDAGLPVASQMPLVSVSQARFIQGVSGLSLARCVLKARTLEGKTLQATTQIHADDNMITKVVLSDILVENKQWEEDASLTITPNKTFNAEYDDHAERLRALRALFGG